MPRIAGGTWQGGAYLYVDYVIAAQSVEGNYTDINYTFGIHFGDYYFNTSQHHIQWNAISGSGSDSWSFAPSLPWPHGGTNQDYAFQSRSVRIFHEADGAGSVNVQAHVNPSSFGGGGTRHVGASFYLPTIPRESSAPSTPELSSITSTSIFVTFADGGGGAPITARQIGYGTNPDSPNTIISSDGSTNITGLTSGSTYYFWARTENAAGFSAWSPRASAATLSVAQAPSAPVISNLTQTSAIISWTDNSDGGSPVIDYDVGYSTSPSAPVTIVAAVSSPKTITGLSPNVKYYFWVRAVNAVGNGPWSASSNATTVAGMYIKVAGVWKPAVPYVKVAGVWKLAQPWTKVMGTWRETI